MRWPAIIPLVTILLSSPPLRAADTDADADADSPPAATSRASAASPGQPQQRDRIVEHVGLEVAQLAAETADEPLLLVFHADWSAESVRLRRQTLADPEFRRQAAPLHLVTIDVDSEPELAEQHRVTALPDLRVLTPGGRSVSRIEGFRSTADLLDWIDRSRRRIRSGAIGQAGGGSDPEQTGADEEALREWVEELGNRMPERRRRAAQRLSRHPERAAGYVIEGLGHRYLGVRIGASDWLARHAPGMPPFDPWADPERRRQQLERIRAWWESSGRGTIAGDGAATATLDASEQGAGDRAIERIFNGNAAERTAAAAVLRELGRPILPKLRRAIDRAEAANDRTARRVLEDVRWALLVPDELEREVGVRRDLARGRSKRRREAAQRLASGGEAALPALRELLRGDDPRVRETTARALGSIGGRRALAALGSLLEADRANLRMVAAEVLGKTKDRRAGPYLAEAVDDPDEVVAITAIAAIEEVEARGQGQVLIDALGDDRWRVRAAAAETLGKLGVGRAADALRELLDDEDPFVIRNAISALQQLGSAPSPERLRQLAVRNTDLTALAVEVMAEGDDAEAVEAITKLYDEAEPATRETIVARFAAIGGGSAYGREEPDDAHWAPLMRKIANSNRPAIRRRLVEALNGRSAELTAEILDVLTADPEPAVRRATAVAIVRLFSSQRSSAAQRGLPRAANVVPAAETQGESGDGDEGAETEGQPSQRYRRWHDRLAEVAGDPPEPMVAIALYATGDPEDELPRLRRSFDQTDPTESLSDSDHRLGLSLVLTRLPWPAGESFLTELVRRPALYAELLSLSPSLGPAVRDYLLAPERLIPALREAEGNQRERIVQSLMLHRQRLVASLAASDEEEDAAPLRELLRGDDAFGRAAGLFLLGAAERVPDLSVFRSALSDENLWVRVAAAQGLARHLQDPEQRERALAPLLDDPQPAVARMAAVGILDPSVRSVAGLEESMRHFHFEDLRVSRPSTISTGSRRPPRPFRVEPDFLETVRQRIERLDYRSQPELYAALSLLLGQYEDFTGLERLLQRWRQNPSKAAMAPLTAALALSRDPKFLPPLRRAAEEAETTRELRELLQQLRGVRGDEARQLRREINRRRRQLE